MKVLEYCKALSDVTRVRLVNLLSQHELNVGEIVHTLDLGQSRVSRHLKILADCGLLKVRREGLWAFYGVPDHGQGRDFVESLTSMFHEDMLEQDLARARRIIREREDATRAFFDSVAPKWGHLSRETLGNLDLATEIMDRMPECDVAVDLGCGPGELLSFMADKARTIIGVDISQGMLDIAAKSLSDMSVEKSLRIGELSHLPLRDWEADFAAMSMVLHHMAEPEEALSEAARVLRVGGRLVVAEFDRHSDESMRREHGDHRLGIAQDEMVGWLEKNRFELESRNPFSINKGLTVVVYDAVRK